VILVKLLANCIFDEKIALLYILSHKLYYLSTKSKVVDMGIKCG